MTYEEKKFSLPILDGISKESVDAHLTLYAGYVKNCNAIMQALADLRKDSEKNAHAIAELVRRFAFEWDGMRMHEYYFSQWEQGAQALDTKSALAAALTKQFGSMETWEANFRSVGMMRGVGWAVLLYDEVGKTFHNVWIGEHMQGHLVSLPVILALDVWEHAYVAQFGTGGRAAYIEAFFKNLHWDLMAKRYENCETA